MANQSGYAELKNNRMTDYVFNFDQMLNDKSNTAVYLLYEHARICSIIRKSGKDMQELNKRISKEWGFIYYDLPRLLKRPAPYCYPMSCVIIFTIYLNTWPNFTPIGRLLGRQRKKADFCCEATSRGHEKMLLSSSN